MENATQIKALFDQLCASHSSNRVSAGQFVELMKKANQYKVTLPRIIETVLGKLSIQDAKLKGVKSFDSDGFLFLINEIVKEAGLKGHANNAVQLETDLVSTLLKCDKDLISL